MTPERMATLVARWVRFYTRKLPPSIARRRLDEIDADLHDHIAHERARGTGDRRIAVSILSRMVRGIIADASWRRRHRGARRTQGTASRAAVRIALVIALILSFPLVAMQVSDEVAWGPADFAFAAGLLAGAGVALEAARRLGDRPYRAAVVVAVVAAFVLLWSIPAVGVVGAEGDRFDLAYIGVLAVGLAGAIMARLRPHGMARALLATALAQALVAVLALIAGKHESPVSSVTEIIGVNGTFVGLFAASAWLFRRAARREPPRVYDRTVS